MTAPYAPTPISPVRSQGWANNPVVFMLKFNAPTSQPAGDYRIIRKAIPSGATEYLTDADTWTTTPTYRTAVPSIEDGELITVEAPTGWVDGTAYEWWANFKGGTGGAEVGPDSEHAIFISVTPVVPALEVETPALDSRPTLRWINTPTTRKQRSFQLAVYPKSIYDDSTFDPDEPGWQLQAVWFQEDPYVASEVFRFVTGEDLDPGVTYRPVINVQDRFGVWSGWTAGNEFTTNFTPPPAPEVELIPSPATGTMLVEVDAAFNLVDTFSSSFDVDQHGWINLFNSLLTYDATGSRLRVEGVGHTFDDANAAHTTFADWDADLGTFDDQAAERTVFLAESHITLRKTDDFLIPVIAGEDYSMIYTVSPSGYAASARSSIRWLDSGLAEILVSHGPLISCLPDTNTDVPSGGFEAPVGAEWAELQLSVTTEPGQVFYVDNVAFARSDNVHWTPGGFSVDLKFVIQRRLDGGDWEYVWGATRAAPLAAQDASLTRAEIVDKACPIGISGVEYRVQVLTSASGKTVSSQSTIVAAPMLISPAWWIRSYDGLHPDIRLRAMDFDYAVGSSNQTHYVQNRDYALVRESEDAVPHSVSVRAWLFDRGEYDMVKNLLLSKRTLYVQRNIGDGFYIHVTGLSRFRQQRAVGDPGSATPRHFHSVDFEAEVVGLPEELVA